MTPNMDKRNTIVERQPLSKISIGYFADGIWAKNAFDLFAKDNTIDIRFICARFNSPDPVLKECALEREIDWILEQNINSPSFIKRIGVYNCDLFVSMSFDQIFHRDIINLPPLKTINCHAGKLPFYRGRNILNWALINDEKEFGITVHYVNEGIDTGDIILQRCYSIADTDTYATLLKHAHKECASILYDAVKQIMGGTAEKIPQHTIHPVGFYCGKRQKGDEFIDWKGSSREIFNFIRALCRPGPMARSMISNGYEIKINRSELIDGAPKYKGIPGQIIGKESEQLIVKTGDSFIKICEFECSRIINIGDRLK
jgi:methionyl-tRNA formyltransferase